jgi:hypothetical protein
MAVRAFKVTLTDKGASQDLLVGVHGKWLISIPQFDDIQSALNDTFKGKGKVEVKFLGCFQESMACEEEDLLKCLDRKRKPRRKKGR